MKKRMFILGAIALLVALTAFPILAQRRCGLEGPKYDPGTEVELAGTVAEVIEVDGPGNRKGIHVKLKADLAENEVCVGPMFYLEAQKISFAVGDSLEIVGSKVDIKGGKAVVAREIRRGGETFTLRDERGIPRWSRRNR